VPPGQTIELHRNVHHRSGPSTGRRTVVNFLVCFAVIRGGKSDFVNALSADLCRDPAIFGARGRKVV